MNYLWSKLDIIHHCVAYHHMLQVHGQFFDGNLYLLCICSHLLSHHYRVKVVVIVKLNYQSKLYIIHLYFDYLHMLQVHGQFFDGNLYLLCIRSHLLSSHYKVKVVVIVKLNYQSKLDIIHHCVAHLDMLQIHGQFFDGNLYLLCIRSHLLINHYKVKVVVIVKLNYQSKLDIIHHYFDYLDMLQIHGQFFDGNLYLLCIRSHLLSSHYRVIVVVIVKLNYQSMLHTILRSLAYLDMLQMHGKYFDCSLYLLCIRSHL